MTTDKSKQSCENCAFCRIDTLKNEEGEKKQIINCRRELKVSDSGSAFFPAVLLDWWCGNWEPVIEQEKPGFRERALNSLNEQDMADNRLETGL